MTGEIDSLSRILAALIHRRVNFVVIGAWAIQAQDYELGYISDDLDLTPELGKENLNRLSQALKDLGAQIRVGGDSFEFDHDGESLGNVSVWNLTCEHGHFDVLLEPSGTAGYRDLVISAQSIVINVDGESTRVLCADLADIVRSKEAALRDKDEQVLPLLRAQLDQRQNRGREE